EIDVYGLDAGGCKIAAGSLTETIDGGGRRERTIALTTLMPPLCTLKVVLEGNTGSGHVVSTPPGIDCPENGTLTCSADYATGIVVQLNATTTDAKSYIFWDGACHGPADSCKVSLSQSQEADIIIQPRICSKDGWCWMNPLPQGNDLKQVARLDDGSVLAVG